MKLEGTLAIFLAALVGLANTALFFAPISDEGKIQLLGYLNPPLFALAFIFSYLWDKWTKRK